MASKEQRKKVDLDIWDFFTRRYHEIDDELEFDPAWQRNTPHLETKSCLDDAVNHPTLLGLAPGRVVKSMDMFGRRMIAVGTGLGPLIVYIHGADVRPWYHDNLLLLPNVVLGILRWDGELAGLIGGVNDGVTYENLGTQLETAFTIMLQTKLEEK